MLALGAPKDPNSFYEAIEKFEREQGIEFEELKAPAFNFAVALLPPILAYIFYNDVAGLVRYAIDQYSGGAGRMVDGNSFAINLLRPTVNGVVVPTLSIALGTLLATTINVLRNRQVEIRACLTTEVGLVRLLRRALFGAYGTAQHARRRQQALLMLLEYVWQLKRESGPNAYDYASNNRGAENALDRIVGMLHGVDGAAVSREFSVSTAAGLIAQLNAQRSQRVAALLGIFPVIHWAILTILAVGIVFVFLIESNQDVLQYLNSLQLRASFAVLISVCSATSMLCYDLNEPFRGGFTIRSAVEQLDTLQLQLENDLRRASRESSAIATQQDWGAKDTVYFHLLTGKLADQVRFLGDIYAWGRNRVPRRLRRESDRTDAQDAIPTSASLADANDTDEDEFIELASKDPLANRAGRISDEFDGFY